jgi:hypothetical protein
MRRIRRRRMKGFRKSICLAMPRLRQMLVYTDKNLLTVNANVEIGMGQNVMDTLMLGSLAGWRAKKSDLKG